MNDRPNEEDPRQTTARNQAAHQAAIKAVAERNEQASKAAKKERQELERLRADLRWKADKSR